MIFVMILFIYQIEFYESLWNGHKSMYRDYSTTKQNVFLLKDFIDSLKKGWCLTHIDAVPDNFLFYEQDNSEKLQLITMLAESVRPAVTVPMLDEPVEEEFSDMDKEFYTPEEAYELVMKDIKAIYDQKDAV